VASGDAWALGELLLHPSDTLAGVPWDDGLDPRLDWEGRRRALLAQPEPARAEWYSRLTLALRRR
jgi:hypothetical protein